MQAGWRGAKPPPSPAGDRREGRDGRGQTGNQEIAMTHDHAPFLTSDIETNDEPHASSPTAHLLDELALYGYRPSQDEPDPRPLPENETVRAELGAIVDAFASMFTDTRLEDEPSRSRPTATAWNPASGGDRVAPWSDKRKAAVGPVEGKIGKADCRMARVPAFGVGPLRRKSVRRGIIVKIAVCPSVRIGESFAVFFDCRNCYQSVRHVYKIGCNRIPFERPLNLHNLGPLRKRLAIGGKALPIRMRRSISAPGASQPATAPLPDIEAEHGHAAPHGLSAHRLDTSGRPTPWLGISDSNFDVQGEYSSL
jgi:hypothetical protein